MNLDDGDNCPSTSSPLSSEGEARGSRWLSGDPYFFDMNGPIDDHKIIHEDSYDYLAPQLNDYDYATLQLNCPSTIQHPGVGLEAVNAQQMSGVSDISNIKDQSSGEDFALTNQSLSQSFAAIEPYNLAHGSFAEHREHQHHKMSDCGSSSSSDDDDHQQPFVRNEGRVLLEMRKQGWTYKQIQRDRRFSDLALSTLRGRVRVAKNAKGDRERVPRWTPADVGCAAP